MNIEVERSRTQIRMAQVVARISAVQHRLPRSPTPRPEPGADLFQQLFGALGIIAPSPPHDPIPTDACDRRAVVSSLTAHRGARLRLFEHLSAAGIRGAKSASFSHAMVCKTGAGRTVGLFYVAQGRNSGPTRHPLVDDAPFARTEAHLEFVPFDVLGMPTSNIVTYSSGAIFFRSRCLAASVQFSRNSSLCRIYHSSAPSGRGAGNDLQTPDSTSTEIRYSP